MNTLELLRAQNPRLPLFDVHGDAFAPFGRVLDGMDTRALCAAAAAEPMPEEGSRYVPVLETLDRHPDADTLRALYWGQLDAQLGLCWGHANRLNALEWHTCSEINVGVTDLVLLLADRRAVRDGRLDSASVRAFCLAQGEAIEVYATTLHFCPCEVTGAGFRCLVALPRGTNTPLDAGAPRSPMLWAKNKWLIAHEQNASLLARGAAAGITGENWALAPITREKEN